MTLEEYIEKYGEYGGRSMEFYDKEGSSKMLSDESKKLLDIINKNYIKISENKEIRDKNIRENISYLADFYLSLFKEIDGERVLQKQIIIDPDEVRKLLAPWGYDKTNAPEYHLIGGELTNAVSRKVFYEYDVKNIAFITGAPASGKSSALRNEAIASKLNLDSYAVIYDSPITSFSIFAKNIANPLLEKGIKISYIQVYNDPVTIFENMLKRGVKEGRFLPPLYFLNGLLAQKDRVRDIASEFKGKEHFTYFGIDNSGNIAKEKLCDLKEAEKIFDYNITLSQINKMLAYGEDFRKHLQKERERIESRGQTGGTRQDVHGGDRILSVASTTRDNENTIADVIRGLLHIKMAILVQLRQSLLYDAGTMENPMVGVGREGDGASRDISSITEEVIDIDAIKEKLIQNAKQGIIDSDIIEKAEYIQLGERLAKHYITSPEKYLPPHYKAMLETNIDDENKFQEGEFAKSERVFTLKKWDYVMGSTNISGPDKVAEMFRHLESFGVENSFAVFIPKGEDGESKAIVQHLSSGERSLSFVNPDAIIQAALRCYAKDVYFVHNHPSGSISPSPQDYQIYSTLSKGLSFFGINLKEGVIINTNTGKYGTFNSLNSEKHNLTKSENLQPYSVLEFSRTIFNKDYKPEDNYKITDSRKVAEFLSRQRFGEGNKIGYFVLNNQLQITGNFFLKETEINSSNVDKIAREVGENAIRYSGACTMLYGRFNMSPTIDLQNKIKTATCNSIRLIDIITFQSKDFKLYNYRSFADEGLLEDNGKKYNTMNSNYDKYQYSFSELKDKISMKEFIYHLGYRPVKGKCCATSAEYKHPGNGESVILQYKAGQATGEGYFTRNGEKGDILNFVKNRLSDGTIINPVSVNSNAYTNVMYCVNVVLHNYLNIPPEIKQQNQEAIQAIIKRTGPKEVDLDFASKIIPLENSQFLYSRGMTTSIINSPLFTNKIFNEKEKPYNIVFPMYNSEGKVNGLEARNKNFKHQFAGSKGSEGVWHSNVPNRIESVFIAESPLDCIAHRAIKGNDNTFYVSFNGSLSWEQIKTINNILDKHRNRIDTTKFSFALGSDNDSAGTNYDIMFIARQLKHRFKGESTVIHQENFRKEISFEAGEVAPKLANAIQNVINSQKETTEQSPIKISTNNNLITINYPDKDYFAERTVCKSILSTNILPFTKLEKAQLNDWNDDLIVCRNNKVSHQYLCENKDSFIKDVEQFKKGAEKSQKSHKLKI